MKRRKDIVPLLFFGFCRRLADRAKIQPYGTKHQHLENGKATVIPQRHCLIRQPISIRPARAYAKGRIISKFQQDGTKAIVLTREDLVRVIGCYNLIKLLKEKAEDIRFGRL